MALEAELKKFSANSKEAKEAVDGLAKAVAGAAKAIAQQKAYKKFPESMAQELIALERDKAKTAIENLYSGDKITWGLRCDWLEWLREGKGDYPNHLIDIDDPYDVRPIAQQFTAGNLTETDFVAKITRKVNKLATEVLEELPT